MPYIGKAPQLQGAYEKADNISNEFNGGASTFTIYIDGVPKSVGKSTNLIVGWDENGIRSDRIVLEPDTDYTVSGTNITFPTPPNSGDYCWIVILGDVGSV